jgi:GNAT superfamily N-acetyltransferase
MSAPNLPQGYSIRRTVQGAGGCFDVYMIAIGLGLITINLFFFAGFLVLPSELFLGLIFGLFLWLLIEHCKHWIQVKQAGKSFRIESWVISFQGDDVGKATIQRMKNYVILRTLGVRGNHQRRGLGTALIKCVISEVDRPIHLLLCTSDLELFYRRLGFVTVENTRMGLRMQRSVSGSTLGLNDLGKVQLSERYTVELVQDKAKWK